MMFEKIPQKFQIKQFQETDLFLISGEDKTESDAARMLFTRLPERYAELNRYFSKNVVQMTSKTTNARLLVSFITDSAVKGIF